MSAASFKDIGNKHLQAGEFDKAIEAYTQAIALDGSDHVFYSNRSAAYLSKGDAKNALADGEKCIQVNSSWAKGYSRKGAALHALHQYDDAVTAYQAGLAIAPADAGLKSGLAEVTKAQESSNRPPPGGGLFGPEFLAQLATHPKFGPKLKDPAFRMKLQMMQTNPQLLMSDPELMEVLQVLIGGKGMGGMDSEGPMDEPQEESLPSFPRPANQPAPASSSSSSNFKNTQVEEMEEPEDTSVEEQQMKHNKKLAVAAKERGNTFYKAKQFNEAIAAYNEAITLDPTNMMFINNKAAVHVELNECDVAIQLCMDAIEIGKANRASFEDRSKVYQRMAAAYLKKDDYDNCIASYEKAQMENFDKTIERKIKTLQLEQKKAEKARYVNPALGLEAKERGNACFREGKYVDAIAEYEDAVKRDPTNAAYHNNLAAAFQKMGAFNDAKREVEKSLELDRTYVKAWAKKGDIEFFMKEYHKSMDSYKAGLQIEPDNSLCKQGLSTVISKINSASTEGERSERAAHAMADPEIQMILSDPMMRQVLQDMQENPKHAQKAMLDVNVRTKIEKLVAAGVLQIQ